MASTRAMSKVLFIGVAAMCLAVAAYGVQLPVENHGASTGHHAREAAHAIYEADDRVKIFSHDGLGTATFLAIPEDVAEPLRQRRSESLDDGLDHFFSTYGAAFGIAGETSRQVVRGDPFVDDLGFLHVRLGQEVRGIPVFSAGVTVHFAPGYKLTSAQGIFVPGLELSTTTPVVAKASAIRAAADAVAAKASIRGGNINVARTDIVVFKRALFAHAAESVDSDEDAPEGKLAFAVRLHHHKTTYFAFVDAINGQVLHIAVKSLDRLNHKHYERAIPDGKDVLVYTAGDNIDGIRNPKSREIVKGVMRTYNMFASLSGGKYLSYDGIDSPIRTRLFLYRKCFDESQCNDINEDAHCNERGLCVPDDCPAFWDLGRNSLSFCQELSTDDTVAHELAHAYMIKTGHLFGENEPGAIDEGMADIWGEVVDLLDMNTIDDNSKAGDRTFGKCVRDRKKQSVRWIQGEDDEYPSNSLGYRDMFSPQCFFHPPETTSPLFVCNRIDNGGIHSNCGVINRAFSTLVDGTKLRYTQIRGLGITKSAAIFWRAQTKYMQPLMTFTEMAVALQQACSDYVAGGAALYEVTTQSAPWSRSKQVITLDDCRQLAKVIDLVNMHGSRCRGPSAVVSFKVKSKTKHSITLHWRAPTTHFNAKDSSNGYRIEMLRLNNGQPEWILLSRRIAAKTTSYTLKNLAQGASYVLRIRATTKKGTLYGPATVIKARTSKLLPAAGLTTEADTDF